MVAKKESAEQKLLQMIEASSGGSSGGALSAKKPEKKKVKIRMSTLAFLSLCANILIVLVVIAVIFLFREINIGSRAYGRPIQMSLKNFEKSTLDINSVFPKLHGIKYYLSAISTRNIFKPYVEPTATTATVLVSPEKNELEITKMVNSLRLVGISWMDKVETASIMIEDIDKKVTYFLQKGEKLNDIIVKTIYADSALLGYKNEEIIIKYEKSQ